MTLGGRFAISASVFALLAALVVGFGSAVLLERQLENAYRERLLREARLLADRIGRVEQATPQFWAEARNFSDRLGVRVTLIAADGRVVIETDKPEAEIANMDNHLGRPELVAARAEGEGTARRRSDSVDRDFLYAAIRLESGGQPAGFVRLAVPARTLVEIDRYYAALMTMLVIAAIVFTVILVMLVGRWLVAPAAKIQADALAIAGGDYERAIDTAREDEIGELTRAIARMRDHLVTAKDGAERERRLLESMVGAIEEGVLMIDQDQRIGFANQRFRALFGVDADPAGRRLVEVLRLPDAVEAFRRAVDLGEGCAFTLRPPPSMPNVGVLELRVVPFGEERRSAVGLFLDMTRIEALERMRQRFVSDVSHELRTPLTGAKIAAETLAASDGIPAEIARFPTMVLRQLGRMEALLDDLTDLSAIETGFVKLELEKVDLEAMVAEVTGDLMAKWEQRAIDLHLHVPSGVVVKADRRRLQQILVNLVDNAFKFSHHRGKVDVVAEMRASDVVVEVRDQGAGIPPADQDRVFQRFYQVDRSRSKALPGTGLGLAIVKHLVILHGGKIALRSEVGKGTTIRLELPSATREANGG